MMPRFLTEEEGTISVSKSKAGNLDFKELQLCFPPIMMNLLFIQPCTELRQRVIMSKLRSKSSDSKDTDLGVICLQMMGNSKARYYMAKWRCVQGKK